MVRPWALGLGRRKLRAELQGLDVRRSVGLGAMLKERKLRSIVNSKLRKKIIVWSLNKHGRILEKFDKIVKVKKQTLF